MYVLCCSEMSTKQNCYTWLLYCHILLRLQSMHQFLPAQFRVVPNEPLLAQVLCTHDHFCNHLMLLPTLMFFRLNTTGTVSKLLLIFIHFQCFLRAEYSEQIFFCTIICVKKAQLFVERGLNYMYKKKDRFFFMLPEAWQCCLPLLSLSDTRVEHLACCKMCVFRVLCIMQEISESFHF